MFFQKRIGWAIVWTIKIKIYSFHNNYVWLKKRPVIGTQHLHVQTFSIYIKQIYSGVGR